MSYTIFSLQRVIKLSVATILLLLAADLSLAPFVNAAGKYDESSAFICVPTTIAECVSEGDCRSGTAESENLPEFFKIDLKAKTIVSEEKNRVSPITRIDRGAGDVTLYGTESGRSWLVRIQEKTGRLSASVTGDGQGYIIFGVCPPR
jgi:hypothetical protein